MVFIDKDQKMKHFRKWAEGTNPLLAAASLNIARFSEECFIMFELIDKGKRIEGDIPLPKLKTWLKLYHNHKRIGKVVIDVMGSINADSRKEADFFNFYNKGAEQLKKHPEKVQKELKNLTPDEWKKIIEIRNKKNEEFFELTINDLTSDFNPKENEELRKNFKKPEFIFLFRVLAPCFTLYNTYPSQLLRKAQSGDDKALEKLIRLDKSIIFEPKISELIHQAQALKAQARISMIKKAFISKPTKINMSMKAIKCNLGGLISYLSNKLRQKITAAEIRKLFDAIACDKGIDAVDPDLYDIAPETFEKAIQRSRSFWNIIIPDIK